MVNSERVGAMFFHLKLRFFKRILKIANWDSEKFPSPPDRREPLAGEIASLHRSLSSPRKDLQTIANLRVSTIHLQKKTRSSWFNCALRDNEAVYWVIIGHYEAVEVGN